MRKPNLLAYMTSEQLLDWAMSSINILKSKDALADHEIAELMRWIGMCVADTLITPDGTSHIRRMGIDLMLTITLLEFPDYYVKYELAQFN